MTLAEVALSLPLSRSLLRSGVRALQGTRRSGAPRSIGTLGLGIALGAGVALLCAPSSGRELRGRIAARLGAGGRHGLEENEETRTPRLRGSPTESVTRDATASRKGEGS